MLESEQQEMQQRRAQPQRPLYPNEKPEKYLPLTVDQFKTITNGYWHYKQIMIYDPVLKTKVHEKCCICFVNFRQNDLKLVLPCKHKNYHASCLIGYLKIIDRCAVCRAEVMGNITPQLMEVKKKKLKEKNEKRNTRHTANQSASATSTSANEQ